MPNERLDAVRRDLAALASGPRRAGSEAETAARQYCADAFAAAGLTIQHERFEFSTFVGRWATPLAGAYLFGACVAVSSARARGITGHGLSVVLVAALGILAWNAFAATREQVLGAPFARARSVNLIGQRGTPRLWLLAHLDTKSQPIPILVRMAAIVGLGIVLTALLAWGAVAGSGTPGEGYGRLAILGAGCALVVAASWVGNRSDGALDNASGVAVVLEVLRRLPSHLGVGIVITSAEELALAGARAWARQGGGAVECRRAINVDTVDDDGPIRLMYHRRTSLGLARGVAASHAGVVVTPVLPGLLTDGVALADEGWEAITASRGTWRTLARIHTRRDSVGRVSGEGVVAVSDVLIGALTRGA